jgi:hypothetical protein
MPERELSGISQQDVKPRCKETDDQDVGGHGVVGRDKGKDDQNGNGYPELPVYCCFPVSLFTLLPPPPSPSPAFLVRRTTTINTIWPPCPPGVEQVCDPITRPTRMAANGAANFPCRHHHHDKGLDYHERSHFITPVRGAINTPESAPLIPISNICPNHPDVDAKHLHHLLSLSLRRRSCPGLSG